MYFTPWPIYAHAYLIIIYTTPDVCLCSKHFTHISSSNLRDNPVCGVRVGACYFYPHCKDKVSEHIKFSETEVLRNCTYYVCDVLFSSPFYSVIVSSTLFFSLKCTPRSELMTCKWVTIHGWIWKTLFRQVGMDPTHTPRRWWEPLSQQR